MIEDLDTPQPEDKPGEWLVRREAARKNADHSDSVIGRILRDYNLPDFEKPRDKYDEMAISSSWLARVLAAMEGMIRCTEHKRTARALMAPFQDPIDLSPGEAEKLVLNLMYPEDDFPMGSSFAYTATCEDPDMRRIWMTPFSQARYQRWLDDKKDGGQA